MKIPITVWEEVTSKTLVKDVLDNGELRRVGDRLYKLTIKD